MKPFRVLFGTLIAAALVLSVTSCASAPEAVPDQRDDRPENLILGIDSLVSNIAQQTVSLLSDNVSRTMAVYYFTVDGRESRISDYLITGLTTEIANLSDNRTTVVSRQGLDRVMSEQSLMLSDLVSEETQVNIGELLGADVILVGYIVPLEDYDKINIQIIEVESGAVLGGFFLNYKLEEGFTRDTVNKTVVVGGGARQIPGVTTLKTIYENFDGSVVSLSPAHYEEYWGERVQYAAAKTGNSEEGYAYLQFEAEFDSADILNDWDDSDLNFYLIFRTDWDMREQDGISFTILPEGYSRISVFIQQTDADGEVVTRIVPMSVNPDEWTDMQIPFTSFMNTSDTGKIDFSKPVSIGFGIPYLDNVNAGYFRDSTFMESRLLVDNIGLFQFNEPDPDGLIEAYEDDVTRAPAVLGIGGAYIYVDYSNSDAGEKRINSGVESENLRTTMVEDGPGGRFLRLSGKLQINEEIRDYLDSGEDLYLIYNLISGTKWQGFSTLSLLIRSETFEVCYLEITGTDTGQYYSTDFSLNSGWTRINRPYSSITSEEGSMAEIPLDADSVSMQFIFALPRPSIYKALRNEGDLEFSIDLDQIMLQ